MSNDLNYPFTIEEVNSPQSQYLFGMNSWLEHIFPEYCPSRFDKLLSELRHLDGKDQIQIFIGLIDNQVIGLMQLLYKEWEGGLLADIDLLGVLKPFRRSGLALALVQQSFNAIHDMAHRYQIQSIGVTTLIDPTYVPIVNLHQKLGGQIRRDYNYSSGDIIVWYSMQNKYEGVATSKLGDQLHLFGQLLENR
jgi:GNAT superfamily N-acetyltransferase